MGAEASKLAVQDRFDELSRRPDISKDDNVWTAMLSSTAANVDLTDDEFFGMITIDDIRRIRRKQPENFDLLLVKTIERLQGLTKVGKVASKGLMGSQINNCCRILSRMAPIIYEDAETDQTTSQSIHRIIDLLKQLLHFPGYTTPLNSRPTQIWYAGIGCPVADLDSAKYDGARIEVLRALLSVLGSQMYIDRADALEYFVSTGDNAMILSSLLNASLAKAETKLSSLTLSVLTVSLVHIGEQKNQFRKLVARLHRPEDLNWLGTRLKHLYEASKDKAAPTSLIWEVVQANTNFSSCDTVVALAEMLVKDVSAENMLDHNIAQMADATETEPSKPRWTNEQRLVVFTLLSMTAQSTWCARSIGPQALARVLSDYPKLARPSIELATLVDVLWNCSPWLVLTDQESHELNAARDYLKTHNTTVYAVVDGIHNILLRRNPALGLETTQPGNWSPVAFQWDLTRFRWYLGVLWGRAYQIEPRVWSHTAMKLFKVAEQKQNTPTVEFLKTAASKFISS